MRNFLKIVPALVALALVMPVAGFAQQPVLVKPSRSLAGFSTGVQTGAPCLLVKYVGTSTGKPTVEASGTGDITLKIAGTGDATQGDDNAGTSPNSGIYDLSSPHATADTWGEVVNLINGLPTYATSNWRAALVSCLASDLTDGTAFTLTAADAAGPKGVAVYRDSTIASATSIFSSQVLMLPGAASTDIQFFLNSAGAGYPAAGKKLNPNPVEAQVAYVQAFREKITSSGTVALAELLGVKRVYDTTGKVSEVVRTLWSETGAATTVEKSKDYNSGPIMGDVGEFIMWRQRTATDLTVESIGATGYMVHQ